jgi:hypothetical protein
VITVDDVLTSSGLFPDRPKRWPPSDEVIANAADLAWRVSGVLTAFGASRKLSSGYRPREVNDATPNAGKDSHHIHGRAVDIVDDDGKLAEFCVTNTALLETLGLWMESPKYTVKKDARGRVISRWVHLQSKPPKSGRRIFSPR